jgi:carbamoyltransferase
LTLNVLGIVTKTHDTGVAILRDGVVAAIMEQERFNRDKHTQLFPGDALRAALDTAQMTIDDVDVVTTPWDVPRLRGSFRKIVFAHFPASLNLLRPAAHSAQNSGIVFLHRRLKSGIKSRLGAKRTPEIVYVAHHDAHASAFFVSPFEEAAVLVMDGYGDEGATSLYTGAGNTLTQHWISNFFDSLGAFYSSLTMYLGFKLFEEGTVMALAACGEKTYVERFKHLIALNPDGSFRLNPDYISFHTHGLIKPFTEKFIAEFGPPRMPGEPLDQRHKDLACAMQSVTEDAVLNLVRALEKLTPSRNLCISGGVALNCVANARILEETRFERVWVPPCASDTGAPLGSALWHYHQTLGKPRVGELAHAFHGKEYSDADIEAALTASGLKAQKLDDAELLRRVAAMIADKKIVGWFQGRYEIGPRALGNRSILADPRDIVIKDILNARIKHREPFRPFAPAVLSERAEEFFEISQFDPFMTLAPRVRPDKVALIPAAVHVDGTGRIQTVDKRYNPRFHALITEFGKLTGVPILINTSFNRQEPVVASPADAISCYLRTSMDALVMNNFVITERSDAASERAAAEFAEQKEAMRKRVNPWRQILEP